MPTLPVVRGTRGAKGGLIPRLLRYAAGSGVATVSSEAAFVLLYGVLHLSPGWGSVLAWLAGAVPNYWLNRSWTWRRTGRPGLRDELLPYAAIIGLTLLIATVATRAADHWLQGLKTDPSVRVVAVAAVFLGVYVVMFLVRFLLLERLFGRLHARDRATDSGEPAGTTSPSQPVDERNPMTAQPEGAGAFSQATGRRLEDSSGVDQRRYRAFQFDLIRPHCGASVLEVGAGLGEFAAQFHGLARHVVTDVDPDAVAAMATRFADRPEVEARRFDLTAGTLDIGDPVSSIVAINVLEHIEDDSGALRSLASMVEPGGRIILWVPGYDQLYGDFDRAVGHVRRYTPRTLTAAIDRAGLRPEEVRPVNLLGGIAWWLTVRRGGVGRPRPALVRTYDRIVVPVTRFVERRLTPPFGQSVFGVAVVPG